MPTLHASGFGGISDEVKYAILAQQLKSRQSPKSMSYPHMQMPVQTQLTELSTPEDDQEKSFSPAPPAKEDDDEDPELVIDEDFNAEDLSKSSDSNEKISAARRTAENILEEAKKMSSHATSLEVRSKYHSQSDCETEKEIKKESKEEANDLVSVSKLVDNATNSMMFSKYFR